MLQSQVFPLQYISKNILQVYTDIYLYIIIRNMMKYVVFLEYFRLIKTYQSELGPMRKVGICLDPKNPVLPGSAQHSSSVFASFARIAPAVATTSEHKPSGPSRQNFQMIHYSFTFFNLVYSRCFLFCA